ncbi:MAG TPA: hypothetical protein VHO47_05730 [Candidatus Babeliales bacterium]|nr:hypothetical protein [Candidatus Babeliales bacterium]
MRETGLWDFSNLDELISAYCEAQTGCPITYSYTLEGARKLLSDFTILEMRKAHIFLWNIPQYVKYQYEKEECFKNVSDDLFAARIGTWLASSCSRKKKKRASN